MYDRFCQEKENGRFPNAIELLLVNVDDKKIRKTINKAAKESSKEMNNK